MIWPYQWIIWVFANLLHFLVTYSNPVGLLSSSYIYSQTVVHHMNHYSRFPLSNRPLYRRRLLTLILPQCLDVLGDVSQDAGQCPEIIGASGSVGLGVFFLHARVHTPKRMHAWAAIKGYLRLSTLCQYWQLAFLARSCVPKVVLEIFGGSLIH